MTHRTALHFVRTPLGRASAFSPDVRLTGSLKAMLKAVDGKTSVSALVAQFADANAADLLRQLEAAGLIKLREERLNDFQLSDFQPSGFNSDLHLDFPDFSPASGLLPLEPTSGSAFSATSPAPLDFQAPQAVSSRLAEQTARIERNQRNQRSERNDRVALNGFEPSAATLPAAGLANIVDLMSTFVLTHFPQQAFTVLAKFEGFQTLSELRASLPEYEVLAKASGSAGLVHLADVAERVREAAAA